MPVIYDKEMGRQWLEESFGDQPMTLAGGAATVSLRADGGR